VAVLRYNCRLVLLMDLIEQQDWLTALDERMIILQDELAEMKRQRKKIKLGEDDD